MIYEILVFIILGIPVAALAWLIISIVNLCRTKKEDELNRKSYLKQIIISAIIIFVWVVAIFGFLTYIAYSISVNGM